MHKIFLYKQIIKRKGFILIYVILAGTIITSLSLFMFSMEIKRKKYYLDNKKYIIKENIRIDNIEYILGKINFIINDNISPLNEQNIKDYFTNNFKINYNNSVCIYYNNFFYIVTKIGSLLIYVDTYTYNIEGNNCNFSYLCTYSKNSNIYRSLQQICEELE